jgi:hypothetical protein
MIIFDNFETTVSDHPQAIRLIRRPISRKIRSKSEVVLGAMMPVFNHISTFVKIRFDRFSRYAAP